MAVILIFQIIVNELYLYFIYYYQPPSNFPNTKAITNPIIVAIPIFIPPSSYASGIIDSANITRIAPAAKDIAIDIINGVVFDKILKPITADIVDIKTAIDQRTIICLLLFPFVFIPTVDANPSGKLEIKIAAINTIFTVLPVTKEIPRAIFSGILSITDPTSNANPDAFLLPPASSP